MSHVLTGREQSGASKYPLAQPAPSFKQTEYSYVLLLRCGNCGDVLRLGVASSEADVERAKSDHACLPKRRVAYQMLLRSRPHAIPTGARKEVSVKMLQRIRGIARAKRVDLDLLLEDAFGVVLCQTGLSMFGAFRIGDYLKEC